MTIIYETERLIIREWEDRDYKDLFEYASDERVAKYLFPPYKDLEPRQPLTLPIKRIGAICLSVPIGRIRSPLDARFQPLLDESFTFPSKKYAAFNPLIDKILEDETSLTGRTPYPK